MAWIYKKAIGGACTEIPQRQCGKEEIYVETIYKANVSLCKSDDIWRNLASLLSGVIARHIEDVDLKNLPSYTDLIICDHIYQRYEDYHLVRNEMNKKNRIQTVDYIVFSENDRYVLNNAA